MALLELMFLMNKSLTSGLFALQGVAIASSNVIFGIFSHLVTLAIGFVSSLNGSIEDE